MENEKIADVYREIGESTAIDSVVYAQSFKLKPGKSDYDRGFVDRYFVQKVNDLTVQEVSPENYGQVMDQLYKKVSLKWKISGPQKSIGSPRKIDVLGVEDFNRAAIKKASETIDGIEKVVGNYLEYWRGH